MADIWKKCLKNPRGMRIILVLSYLLTTFGIPLTHTCELADNDIHHYQSNCDGHQLHCDEPTVTAFYQYDSAETDESHDQYCMACLHSITSKTFKLCSDSLYATQTVVRNQVLPQSSFVMQLQWLSSAPLRAPPSMTS